MDEKTEYVPPTATAGVSYGWGPYWSGYGGWYGSVYSPGYLVNTTIVRLQTRLWSAAGEGKPVWTGVSESVDPQGDQVVQPRRVVHGGEGPLPEQADLIAKEA